MIQDFQVFTIPSTVERSGSYADAEEADSKNLSIQHPYQHPYHQSDWAILNGTSLQQLRRRLTQDNAPTADEIAQCCALLSSYHAVCRFALLQRRAQGHLGVCLAPSEPQLQQIAQKLNSDNSPAQLRLVLLTIAQRLRPI